MSKQKQIKVTCLTIIEISETLSFHMRMTKGSCSLMSDVQSTLLGSILHYG
jgi:hypothetical protein